MNILENIKALATENGTTYTAVEKELWGKTGVMIKWEKGFPRLDKIYDVAKFFNVPVEYFITGERSTSLELTERETVLLEFFRATDELGKAKITQFVMNEKDRSDREKTNFTNASAG